MPTPPADLYGQFVRIAPRGSSTPAHVGYERFGTLTDLGHTAQLGLTDEDGDVRAYPADQFDVQPWARRRVHVFRYEPESRWTWCQERDGEIYDNCEWLPRCAGHGDALVKALAWLAGRRTR